MSDNQRVYVNILDKEYQIACPPSERDALHRAAEELDSRMRSVRNAGSIVGLERIAVMVALNLCHELQKVRNNSSTSNNDQEVLDRILNKLDSALEQ